MIDTLLSSALNNSKINHEEFTNIINEKSIYKNIKENIKDTTEKMKKETYCLACRKYTKTINPKIVSNGQNRSRYNQIV